MGSMRSRVLALALLALLPSGLRAQEPPAPGSGPAAPAADPLAEARRAHERGQYADAEKAYRRAVEAGGVAAGAAQAGLARVLSDTGRIPEALAAGRAAVEAAPKDTDLRVLLGLLQSASGELEGAEATLRAAVEGAANRAVPKVALADLLRATGRRKEALALYAEANDLWVSGGAEEPPDLVAVARARFAAMELDPGPGYDGQKQSTLEILAGPLKAEVPEAVILLAEAYTRNNRDTRKVRETLKKVFTRNPWHPDALVAAARAREARFESGEAADLAKKALVTNPVHPGAIEVLALLQYGDGDRKGAEELVRRGLAARPKERALLALDAVPACLDDDAAGFEKAVRKTLAVDPTYGRAYWFASRVLEDQRRFAEAAALARRAVEVDPLEADGWFSLARNLLNLGKEKEAKEALAKADAATPWQDLFRSNFQTVLEELEAYSAGATRNFQVRIHATEDAPLRPLYERAVESSFEDLRKRYGYDPEVPVLVEVFRDRDSFSARTLGVPGFGAVGACFGRVVTLDSPAALPPGLFSWRSTVHHELAHVFHLQMTGGRVPRWFTEGLAVHEEEVAYPTWVRNMDRQLVSALANGEVKGLREINGAFRTDVLWAYYQAGLMLRWMERDFGWRKILEMLRLYGKGCDDEAAVREGLGLSVEEFDARFLESCRRMTGGWSVRPIWSDRKMEEFHRRSERDPKDLEAHLHYAEACLQRKNSIDPGTALARVRAAAPEDPFLTELRGVLALQTLKSPDRGMALLREALEKGREHFDLLYTVAAEDEKRGDLEAAVERFRRAKVLFPRATGPRDPREQLARIYTGLGKPDDATREMEEVAAMSETDLDVRMALATVYERRGDAAAAARVLKEALDIEPLPGREKEKFPAAETHARLAKALSDLGRPGEAADSFRLAAIVGRSCDPRAEDVAVAKWLVGEARAARAAGRESEARAALEDAVRTDPRNTEAAEMLRALGGG
jgi:tetratricopeptide (TPR) repeat protein